jgi:hypothetical protein
MSVAPPVWLHVLLRWCLFGTLLPRRLFTVTSGPRCWVPSVVSEFRPAHNGHLLTVPCVRGGNPWVLSCHPVVAVTALEVGDWAKIWSSFLPVERYAGHDSRSRDILSFVSM